METTNKKITKKKHRSYTKAEAKLKPGQPWDWAGEIDHENAKEIFRRKKEGGTPYIFTINEALAIGLGLKKVAK